MSNSNADTKLTSVAIQLLKQLIATPSFSKEENQTADAIAEFLRERNVDVKRPGNNVWATNLHFDLNKPTILLNSHHDTVRPNGSYTRNPFEAAEENGRLYGLGSNDAGGALVSLLAVFLQFYKQEQLQYNLVFAATAEEEISGKGGVESILPTLPPISFALVGEPTQMQMAVAERGLLVLDCTAKGVAGHAARLEGVNAIYSALDDIMWFKTYRFEKVSELLGPVRMAVTSVSTANKAHNIIPDECSFIVDVRVNECYTHEEVLQVIRSHVKSEVIERSSRLRSTTIAPDHPIVKAGERLGLSRYGSPTSSDKALMPFPALKIGPGDSARSHTADEYIFVQEIVDGITIYKQLLEQVINES